MNSLLQKLMPQKNTQALLRALAIIALLGLGVVKNPAQAEQQCQLQLSEPGVDYGQFTRNQPTPVQGSGLLSLGKRTLTLTATCGEDSVIALTFKGEPANEHGYRFARNGVFILKVANAQVDGKPVLLHTLDATQTEPSERLIRPGDEVVSYSGPTLAAGERMNVQIEIETMIDRAGTRVSADETWEGSGHFEVRALKP